MKVALIVRWSKTLNKLRPAFIKAVKSKDLNRAQVLINRINVVCAHQRATNIKNGMPGNPWVNVSLSKAMDDLKNKIVFLK